MSHLALVPPLGGDDGRVHDELLVDLAGAYETVASGDGWVMVRALGSGVAGQRIEIHRIRAFDEPWLAVIAEIADAAIGGDAALRHNATLAYGAIAAREGYAIVRAALPVASLTGPVLLRVVRALAEEAAYLRAQMPPPPCDDVFLNYVE
jgi:hypothetical protein